MVGLVVQKGNFRNECDPLLVVVTLLMSALVVTLGMLVSSMF